MKLNLNKLDKAIAAAFNETADFFAEAQIERIEGEIWDYPRKTRRRYGKGRTGLQAGSPRDIVDSGELRDSLEQSNQRPLKREYKYTSDHAAAVHEGWTSSTGKTVPPRPWTERAYTEEDLEAEMAERLKRRL